MSSPYAINPECGPPLGPEPDVMSQELTFNREGTYVFCFTCPNPPQSSLPPHPVITLQCLEQDGGKVRVTLRYSKGLP